MSSFCLFLFSHYPRHFSFSRLLGFSITNYQKKNSVKLEKIKGEIVLEFQRVKESQKKQHVICRELQVEIDRVRPKTRKEEITAREIELQGENSTNWQLLFCPRNFSRYFSKSALNTVISKNKVIFATKNLQKSINIARRSEEKMGFLDDSTKNLIHLTDLSESRDLRVCTTSLGCWKSSALRRYRTPSFQSPEIAKNEQRNPKISRFVQVFS